MVIESGLRSTNRGSHNPGSYVDHVFVALIRPVLSTEEKGRLPWDLWVSVLMFIVKRCE
jgi:hypothetical protein